MSPVVRPYARNTDTQQILRDSGMWVVHAVSKFLPLYIISLGTKTWFIFFPNIKMTV